MSPREASSDKGIVSPSSTAIGTQAPTVEPLQDDTGTWCGPNNAATSGHHGTERSGPQKRRASLEVGNHFSQKLDVGRKILLEAGNRITQRRKQLGSQLPNKEEKQERVRHQMQNVLLANSEGRRRRRRSGEPRASEFGIRNADDGPQSDQEDIYPALIAESDDYDEQMQTAPTRSLQRIPVRTSVATRNRSPSLKKHKQSLKSSKMT